MARSSFASPLHARTRHPDAIRPPQGSRASAVLPLRSPLVQRRDTLCRTLTDLATAWQLLDVRDEPGWAAFSADAALDLARHLAQHAAEVRSATAGPSGAAWSGEPRASQIGTESSTSASEPSDLSDAGLSARAASAASAADAVALAFLAVVDSLAPTDTVLDVLHAAAALGVIDIDMSARDLGAAGSAGGDRRAS